MRNYVTAVIAAFLGGLLTLGGYKLFFDKEQKTQWVDNNNQPQWVQTSLTNGKTTFEFNENSFVDAASKTVNSVVHVKNVAERKEQHLFLI